MTLKRVLTIAAAAALLICGAYAGYLRHRERQAVSLAPTGPFPVGRAIHELADRSRIDELSPRGGNPRVLSVWLWYPAGSRSNTESAYAPEAWAGLHKFGWAETGFDKIRTGTYDEAPVATGTFPIVVLMPGLGFSAPQYSALAADLASHGYLVAGVTPTYSANLTVLGGHPVKQSAAGDPSDLDGPPGDRLAAVWAADARFAADQVGVLLGPAADRTRVVYLGHSFGGAASLEACRVDPRCVGAADLDGTPVGPVVTLGLQHPMLLLSSGRDGAAGDAATRSLFAASGPTAWAYTLARARHFDFSDYGAYWLAAPLRAVLPLADRRTIAITRSYLAAFLDTAMAGNAWRAPDVAGVRAAGMASR